MQPFLFAFLRAVAAFAGIVGLLPASASAQTACMAEQLAPLPSLRSAEGKFVFVTTLKRKPGVSDADFHAYLSDVHGGLAARLPGVDEYWQNHVAADTDGAGWPQVPGISYDIAPEGRFDASNPAVFPTEQSFRRYFATTAPVFLRDEQNLFQETVAYTALPGNLRVFVEEQGAADALGLGASLPAVRLLVMLQKAGGVDVQAFRDYLARVLTPALTDPKLVSSLRLYLFEPVDNRAAANASAENVSHTKAPEKQYQASWEITFRSPLAMSTLFASEAYRATLAEQPRFFRAIHAYRLSDSLAMVREGRPTPVGLRGAGGARLIQRLGACNQLAPDVAARFVAVPPGPAPAADQSARN